MTGNDFGSLLYLLLLLAFVGGVLLRRRSSGGTQALRHAGSWVVIFGVAILAAGLWDDIRRDAPQSAAIVQDGRIDVPRAADGHYYLTVDVDGEPVRFLVDTGATDIVLTRQDAERIGIRPDDLNFIGRAGTANGSVSIAPVRFDTFSVGPISDVDVYGSVSGGEMRTSLLGMSYLRRYDRIEIADDRLILER